MPSPLTYAPFTTRSRASVVNGRRAFQNNDSDCDCEHNEHECDDGPVATGQARLEWLRVSAEGPVFVHHASVATFRAECPRRRVSAFSNPATSRARIRAVSLARERT